MELTKKIQFPSSNNTMLDAKLDLPAQTPIAYAIFAHCFACSKDLTAVAHISKALTKHGVAVFRFDFTGLGKSEGEFAETNFSSNVDDIYAAADYLRQNVEAPKILIGHSLGGTAILAAAGKIPEAIVISTIASPSSPSHVIQHFEEKLPEILAKGEVEVTLGLRTLHIRKQFLDDVNEQNVLASLSKLNKALLIFHSPTDTIVNIDHARKIYEAAQHPKSFVSLDQANHLLTNKRDAIYVADVLAAWASRYVCKQIKTPAITPEEGRILVVETGQGKFAQEIYSKDHMIKSDEPLSYGGDNTGFSPYELLLAGLGACTSMTVRLYADRAKIPLEKVTTKLSHKKIHAEDCADCETKIGKLDFIDRKLKLEGNLTEAQRKRLLEIANKCPVHQTLTSEIKINTDFEEDS